MINYKKIFIPAILLFCMGIAGCQRDINTTELTTISIEDPIRHYSPVIQGEGQDIIIKVFNTGENLLKIFKVYPSCGCTIAKFPESAIAPGNFGTIELRYDSNKNIGYVGVYTTIVTNTKKKSNTIFFDLNVVPDADYIKDYEELYLIEKESSALIKKVANEQPAKKGYRTNSSDPLLD